MEKAIKQDKENIEYSTGAKREDKTGKGRMDLIPVSTLIIHRGLQYDEIKFLEDTNLEDVIESLQITLRSWLCKLGEEEFGAGGLSDTQEYTIGMIALSKHFEEGGILKGDHNWKKGLPVKLYFSAALRHYIQHYANKEGVIFDDEYHLRAAVWNISAALETIYMIYNRKLPKELLEGTLLYEA